MCSGHQRWFCLSSKVFALTSCCSENWLWNLLASFLLEISLVSKVCIQNTCLIFCCTASYKTSGLKQSKATYTVFAQDILYGTNSLKTAGRLWLWVPFKWGERLLCLLLLLSKAVFYILLSFIKRSFFEGF